MLDSDILLLCLPYAGGSPAVFGDWDPQALPGVAVEPVCLPGRGVRMGEPPLTRLLAIAERLAEEICSTLERRFAIFGHSMGGLLAFELTRALRRIGAPPPSLLVTSAVRAAHVPLPRLPFHLLSDDQLIATVSRFGHIPPALRDNTNLLKLFLPVLRADLEAYETYSYYGEEPLGVPILAIGGTEDPMVPAHTLTAWQAHTKAKCRVRFVHGGHFFLHTARSAVLSLIAGELQSFQRPSTDTAG
jgi:medium-chain acyl-[acyl-carrier-protein] hydrolase